MAVFDVVDEQHRPQGRARAARTPAGDVFGVDHGLTFNVEDKLRTVLWGWAGDPLLDEACEVLDRLVAGLAGGAATARLAELLARREVARTARRAARLLPPAAAPGAARRAGPPSPGRPF